MFEINNFCKGGKIKIEKWMGETISGTGTSEKRELGKMIEKLNKGDIVICSELSRLGRSLFMILDVLSFCMQKEIKP